ncbi:M23 family metallopeptidase [Methyloglobulus sp.]|uniref:M23 family metallopeptidase n=1 Tax=Methyloglobulus sp. TaxID=2518622 RepID=UPI0039895A7B
MKRLKILILFASSVFCVTAVHAVPTAGQFLDPFNPGDAWTACSLIGYKRDQYHMQWNDDFDKYHNGEDWNGKCGSSSDKGARLDAMADGQVTFVDNATARNNWGKRIVVRYTLPDNTQVDAMYAHVDSVLVSPGSSVGKGQKIATVGDANGYYDNAAHLHWEMRRDLTLSPGENPYHNPLSVNHALKYLSPALFVDDRRSARTTVLSSGKWTYITPNYNAPSSTAFIERYGIRYSLTKAANVGWIYGRVYQYVNNTWQYYPDLSKVFFDKGIQYAIYTYTDAATLYIFAPGDNYRADRARSDMLQAARQDSRFLSIMTENYSEDINWSAAYELRMVSFNTTSGITSVAHATYKSNPLVRHTTIFDPDTLEWRNWVQVDWNKLQ